MAIEPGALLPVCNKQERTVENFWLDAIMNMHLAGVINAQEAADLMDRVNSWVDFNS